MRAAGWASSSQPGSTHHTHPFPGKHVFRSKSLFGRAFCQTSVPQRVKCIAQDLQMMFLWRDRDPWTLAIGREPDNHYHNSADPLLEAL